MNLLLHDFYYNTPEAMVMVYKVKYVRIQRQVHTKSRDIILSDLKNKSKVWEW